MSSEMKDMTVIDLTIIQVAVWKHYEKKLCDVNKFNHFYETNSLKDSNYKNWLKKKWKIWIAL